MDNFSDGNNFIKSYKDRFIAIWSYDKNLFISEIFDNSFLEKTNIYHLGYGERVVTFVINGSEAVIGIDSIKYCKLISYNLETHKKSIVTYRNYTLVDIYITIHGLVTIMHYWDSSFPGESSKYMKPQTAKTVLYIGSLDSSFTRIISIDNVYTSPFSLMLSETQFMICWQDIKNNLQMKILDIQNNTIKTLDAILSPFWCYTVGTSTSEYIDIAGYIPNVGIEIYRFNYELELISTKIIKGSTAAPHIFTTKDRSFIAIEPYTCDYAVDIYPVDSIENSVKKLQNTIDPNFCYNKEIDATAVLKLSINSIIGLEIIDSLEFEFSLV